MSLNLNMSKNIYIKSTLNFAMDILFLRAPHKIWKLITHWDNFVPDLGQLSIAAFLREKGCEIRALDSCINQWGWNTTTKAMKMLDPPVVGLGGPITWYEENMRMFRILKELNPNIVNIYGGPFPTLCPEKVIFPGSPVDYIVYGEGEYTTWELLKELRKSETQRDFSAIRGLIYLENNLMKFTPPRPLIKNLDELPIPAYDLLPMDRYGDKRGMWGNLISVYHSKGCVDNCKFCSCWRLGGDIKSYSSGDMNVTQCWRTKSVNKTLEELKYIQDTWHKELFLFCDDTWNANPKWNEEYANKYHKEYGLETDWFAFMRADFIYRDIKNGIFKKLYDDAYLRHIIVGIEKGTQFGLDTLGKHTKPTHSEYMVRWIRENCRDLFVQGTFISGLWEDKPEDFYAQERFAKAIGVDYPCFHVVTPFPGTDIYKWYDDQNLIDKTISFEDYEFDTAIVPTKYMTQQEIAKVNKKINMQYASDPVYMLRGLFLTGRARAKLYRQFVKRMIILLSEALLKFENPFVVDEVKGKHTDLFNNVEPRWYNS